MSERILNGNFGFGDPPYSVLHWDNGVGGANPFTYLVSKKIRGGSYEQSIAEKSHNIRQGFAVNNEVIIAKISVWGQWEAFAGEVNGYNQFMILIKRPDTSVVTLLSTVKTAESGSGQLLDAVDIKSYFNQYGNYELWLNLKTKSAKSTTISEPYTGWTNGGDLFYLYDSDNKCRRPSGEADENQYIATMTKQFTANGPSCFAPLTVQAKGYKANPLAIAQANVRIRKGSDAWQNIYSGELSGDNWQNIINNQDISSYISSAGTYELQLRAIVESAKISGQYYIAEIDFGNVDFVFYSQSLGHYDDISIDISVKKYKTIVENIGATELPQKFISKEKKEDIELTEECTSRIVVPVLHSEKEDIEITESFSIQKIRPITRTEAIEISEFLQAKKTHGNMETTYFIIPNNLTSWIKSDPKQTNWILDQKTKLIGGEDG